MTLTASLCWTWAGVAAVVGTLSTYALTQHRAWATERGIRSALPWAWVTALQAVGAFTAATFVHHTWGTGPGIAASAFVWLGILAVCTDLGSRRVPWEVPLYLVAPVGLVCFAANYTLEGLLALTTGTVGIVGVPLLVRWLTHKGLGASDVRVLWAASATCAWWVGQTWLLYAMILACLIQGILRLAATPLNLGDMVPKCPDRPAPENGPVVMRRELPFAPALVAALAVCITYGTVVNYGACRMWNVFGVCG